MRIDKFFDIRSRIRESNVNVTGLVMELTEDQLQSAISEAIESISTLDLLKRKAELSGISEAASGAKAFLKLGSRALVLNVEKRKAVPRKWVEAQAKRQGMECADCGRELQLFFSDRDDYGTWDHTIALNQGGEHSRRNGRVVCRSCNSAKSDSSPVEFSKHTGHLMTRLAIESVDSE